MQDHDKKEQKSDNSPSRRSFLTKSAAWAAGTIAATSLGESLFAQNQEKPEKHSDSFQIFDCHLHCPAEAGEKWQWHIVTKNFEEFASYLDKTGVQRGIINSQRSFGASPAEFIAGNREVARYVDRYKGRFLGACVVNPLFIEESLKEIEYCHDQLGFVWIGELVNYMFPFDYTIKEFELLVNHATKLNMVLALHTEQGEMEYIAQKFPNATIAFAHFGDDHEYDDIFKRIDLVAQNPNYYLDTSGYGHDRVGVLEYAVAKIGPDRVLFGSDFSINDPSTVIARIKNSFLTTEQKQKIFSGNLENLLKKVHIPK